MFKDASFGGKAGITPTDAEKNADFYRKRSTEINLLLFKNNKQITKLNDIKNKYKKQFIDYNAQYNPPTSEISITLNSSKDFETTMLLKYVIASAGWSPKYDIRTNGTSNDVKLIFRAMAFNNSGLDWKDVKLTLSTASPNFGIKVPTLSKWYLGSEQMAEQEELAKYVQVQDGEFYNKIESGKMELNEVQIAANGAMGYDNARFLDDGDKQQIKKGKQKQMNANSDVKFNKIEVDAISNEFEVKDTYTILSDAKPYTVDVLERDAKGTFEYKALPSIEKEVFLQTKLALKDLPDLVSGEANVYFGGSYIGKTTIKTIDLEDSLLVSLGRDKKVQLQRKEIKQEYSRSIVGNNEKTISKFETTFKNNREVTILLTVEDQIPLANNSDQEINLNEADGAIYDKASGKLIWKLELKPGEGKTIKMGYTAKYPKGSKTRQKKYRTISSPSF